MKKYLGTLGIIGLLLSVYALVTDVLRLTDPVLFPSITTIAGAMSDSLPKLFAGLQSSLALLIPSYSLALALGISLGVIIGRSKILRPVLSPIIHSLSPIPPTLYIPYAITLMPTFWYSSAAVIFIGCFWPILTGTINGVVLIETRYFDNARTLNLKGMPLLRYVILPAASPMIFSGAGMALVFSFILLTIAEMFGAYSGLGYFIQYYADFADYARVLAGMVFMSTFIVLVMLGFDRLKQRVLHWTLSDN